MASRTTKPLKFHCKTQDPRGALIKPKVPDKNVHALIPHCMKEVSLMDMRMKEAG